MVSRSEEVIERGLPRNNRILEGRIRQVHLITSDDLIKQAINSLFANEGQWF
jgi:hypothetical protein